MPRNSHEKLALYKRFSFLFLRIRASNVAHYFQTKKNNSLFFSHRFPRCDRARNLFYPHRKISFFPTTIHDIYKHMNDNKIATPPHKSRHLIFISLSKHDLTHKRTTGDIAHIFKKMGQIIYRQIEKNCNFVPKFIFYKYQYGSYSQNQKRT